MSYVTFLLHCIHKIFVMFNEFSEAVKTVNKTKREPECSREWSPCSVTCGYGLSHRYGSETCDVIKDTRVCYPTPCNTSTIEWVCISYDINSVKQIVNNCRYYVFVFTWYFFHYYLFQNKKKCKPTFRITKKEYIVQNFGNQTCHSVRKYRLKFCSTCARNRCCYPWKTSTRMLEFFCNDKSYKYLKYSWTKRCKCDKACPKPTFLKKQLSR